MLQGLATSLAAERSLAEVTLQTLNEAVVIVDIDGKVSYLNPAAEQLSGWDADDARNRRCEEVLQLAIDDFGTGYSSLSYLKRFPVNRLKIDRAFVHEIPDDPDDVAIVRAIVAMGQNLRLKLTAEGVELTAQADFFAGLGEMEAQGFLLHRPLSAVAFEELPTSA